MADQVRYVFISGGVISGLGKGIVTASLGALLKDRGYTVAAMKIDAYLNQDAGTMNPIEHGEVFVTADGLETDQDLGHYERFGLTVDKHCYATMGGVLRELLDQERSLTFQGKTVEMVPHVPNTVIKRIEACGAAHDADFVLVELGGTVGEYQIQLFLEAARVMTKRHRGRVAHVHVAYVPFVESLGEMKSKPAQLSVQKLYEAGIQPDFLVVRSAKRSQVDKVRIEKIASSTNLDPEDIILAPDVDTIYEVPLVFHEQRFVPKLLRALGVEVIPRVSLTTWKERVATLKDLYDLDGWGSHVRIGIVAKYIASGEYSLADSYVSVLESLKHAQAKLDRAVDIIWIPANELEGEDAYSLDDYCLDGVIIPQGWGGRGSEGKIKAIQWARKYGVPYLGLCYGMQMAAVEFARNVLKLPEDQATSIEIDPKASCPVIDYMQGQHEAVYRGDYGGTIRLGEYPCAVKPGTKLHEVYGVTQVTERHRHRCEFNGGAYRKQFEKAGMVFSGTSPDGSIVEALELPHHPFFVGVQFHPEYQSRFETPHPLFVKFVQSCVTARREPKASEAAVEVT